MLGLPIGVLWVGSSLGLTCFVTETTGLKMECSFSAQKKSPQAYVWWSKCITTIHNFFQDNFVFVTFSNLVITSRKCSELKQFSNNLVSTLEKKKFPLSFTLSFPDCPPAKKKKKKKKKKKDPETSILGFKLKAYFIYLFIFRMHQLNLFIFFELRDWKKSHIVSDVIYPWAVLHPTQR